MGRERDSQGVICRPLVTSERSRGLLELEIGPRLTCLSPFDLFTPVLLLSSNERYGRSERLRKWTREQERGRTSCHFTFVYFLGPVT